MASFEFSFTKKGMDADSPVLRVLRRPVEVREDIRQMKERRRVSLLLRSKVFRQRMNELFERQMKHQSHQSSFSLTFDDPKIAFKRMSFPWNVIGKVIEINDFTATHQSTGEQRLRCKLASVCRLIDLFGWSNSSRCTRVMVRLPAIVPDQFLVNPIGLPLGEVTGTSLLDTNLTENSATLEHSSECLFLTAALKANHKLRCAIYISTPATITVSQGPHSLLPITYESIIISTAGFAQNPDQLEAFLSPSPPPVHRSMHEIPRVLFISGQGVLTVGVCIEEAWFYATNAVLACEAQIKLAALSSNDVWLPAPEECQLLRQQLLSMNGSLNHSALSNWSLGEMEFEAWMRFLDSQGCCTGHEYRITNNSNGIRSQRQRRKKYSIRIPACSVTNDTCAITPTTTTTTTTTPPIRFSPVLHWKISPNQYVPCQTEHVSPANKTFQCRSWKSLKDNATAQGRKQESKSFMLCFQPNTADYPETYWMVKSKYFNNLLNAGPRSRFLDEFTQMELKELCRQGHAIWRPDEQKVTILAAGNMAIVTLPHRHPWKGQSIATLMANGNPFNRMDEREQDLSTQQSASTALVVGSPTYEKEITPETTDIATEHVQEEEEAITVIKAVVSNTIPPSSSKASTSNRKKSSGKKMKLCFKLPSFSRKKKLPKEEDDN